MRNIAIFIFVCTVSFVWSGECSLYLAPSLLRNAGYGVFTGHAYDENITIEKGPAVLFGEDLFSNTQLENYLYSSHDARYAVAVFGAGMMFNHLEEPNLNHDWNGEPHDVQAVNIRPFGTYSFKNYSSNRDIAAGEELFASYGKSTWFSDRGIPYNSSVTADGRRYSITELQERGHCLSDVHISTSTVPLAGRGLFSSRGFATGELVTISPVLMLPKHVIQREASSSLLLNYVMSREESDVAVLPMGRVAYCNHAPNPDHRQDGRWGGPNLAAKWVSNIQGNVLDNSSLSDAERAVAVAASPLLLGYFATSDISPGEELFLSYGAHWEAEWRRHLELVEHWLSTHCNSPHENATSISARDHCRVSRAPQFREPMQAPDGLFPAAWMDTPCLGPTCGKERRQRTLFTQGQTAQSIQGIQHTRHLKDLNIVDLRASRDAIRQLQEGLPLLSPPGGLVQQIVGVVMSWAQNITGAVLGM
jgi:hypothetical protein